MTPEQRLERVERILGRLVKSGRRARTQWGQKVDILIDTQIRHSEEWRAEHRALDEKIGILVDTQIATNEQLKKTDEQIKHLATSQAKTDEQIEHLTASQAKTDEQIEHLTASQAKTDEALRRFINSLSKGRNGSSSN